MPCYDPQAAESRREIVYLDRENPNDKKTIADLTKQNSMLTAGLCALISELEDRNLAFEIIPEASRKGLIDLMGFWTAHKAEDETRLANELHKYSIQEQEVLRRLLNRASE